VRETQYDNGTSSVTFTNFDKRGNRRSTFHSPSRTSSGPTRFTLHKKGSGDTDKPDSGDAGKPDSGDTGKPKGIAKQQDPYDGGGGVVVWIPPSCGSADCNGIRAYLKNPKGTIGQIIGKGTRVHGDREGGGTGTGSRLVIDQHGLVVSYGADSGLALSGKGRPRYSGPTRIQK